ncbi:MAG: hypothetical protein DRG33_03130 [Deltaproteobacteria bacterium]|nr:MAG: hypothetical protein DRG33_03130 [Deltaproteobacteria bacterium]
MAQQLTVGEATVLLLRALGHFIRTEPWRATFLALWSLGLAALLSAVWGSLKEHEPRAASLFGLAALGWGVLGILFL